MNESMDMGDSLAMFDYRRRICKHDGKTGKIFHGDKLRIDVQTSRTFQAPQKFRFSMKSHDGMKQPPKNHLCAPLWAPFLLRRLRIVESKHVAGQTTPCNLQPSPFDSSMLPSFQLARQIPAIWKYMFLQAVLQPQHRQPGSNY